jgi:hypothetical protein
MLGISAIATAKSLVYFPKPAALPFLCGGFDWTY